ncbi:hypothetical protein BU15DRAFT_59514 [Melanogaster broomeanus]|nr:hypothetical protein BU15DRAFT_59514 [Melanogaster broomeanus]
MNSTACYSKSCTQAGMTLLRAVETLRAMPVLSILQSVGTPSFSHPSQLSRHESMARVFCLRTRSWHDEPRRWCRVTTVVKLLQIKLGQTPPHKPCMPRGMIVPDPPRRSCGEWGIRCHLTTIIASSIKFPVPGKYNISLSLHKGKNEQADSCCIGPASDSDQDIVVLASDAQTESPASVWHLTEVIKESGKYDIHVEDSTTDRTAAPGIDGGLHATGDVTTWEINACGDGHWLVMDVSGNHWDIEKQPTAGKPVTDIHILYRAIGDSASPQPGAHCNVGLRQVKFTPRLNFVGDKLALAVGTQARSGHYVFL